MLTPYISPLTQSGQLASVTEQPSPPPPPPLLSGAAAGKNGCVCVIWASILVSSVTATPLALPSPPGVKLSAMAAAKPPCCPTSLMDLHGKGSGSGSGQAAAKGSASTTPAAGQLLGDCCKWWARK
ncbi:hypothetical protein Vafri_9459 [Volvox africanus]|uniref:Uncharacterized protein n=1 Tax=Volvox africanus TaxID=51714 RepID=A0A8J4B520_9CHLO|nr:hypothetical protein Vafri_9459 [Volvox africanus]